MATLHALDLATLGDVPPVCAVHGDEPFLKRLALGVLRRKVLGTDDGQLSCRVFSGAAALPRDVFDELQTVALFGPGPRMAVVEEADDFVSKHRGTLEDYVARPAGGVLVLEVGTWPSNTRLAKAVAASHLAIDCSAPPRARLLEWLGERAKSEYHVRLEREAADALTEIVGTDLGRLDQELGKLASAARGGTIGAELVDELVGGWRAKTTWDMLDGALAGSSTEAITQLERLLAGGESAVGLLAQIGASLRRFAAAVRIIEQAEQEGGRISLRDALVKAGVKPVPFILNKAEQQLRRVGRQRAAQLYEWLLEADLALKGTSSAPQRARIVLETLLVQLAASGASAR